MPLGGDWATAYQTRAVPPVRRRAWLDHFRDAPQVYAAGKMLLYYEEGNPAPRQAKTDARRAAEVCVVEAEAELERLRAELASLWGGA